MTTVLNSISAPEWVGLKLDMTTAMIGIIVLLFVLAGIGIIEQVFANWMGSRKAFKMQEGMSEKRNNSYVRRKELSLLNKMDKDEIEGDY